MSFVTKMTNSSLKIILEMCMRNIVSDCVLRELKAVEDSVNEEGNLNEENVIPSYPLLKSEADTIC